MDFFNTLANGLVLAGACILVGTLFLAQKLIYQLPSGQLRRKWHFLTGMIIIFIIGYISYEILFWASFTSWTDIIVPGVFFFGAAFVWLTINISLQTTIDVRRVSILEQENISDSLTGIYNRRYLDSRLKEECARARRYQLPLSIILIDVDHFKHINDTYGHQVGDQTLCTLGKLLLQIIRDSDIAARYGGDEMVIIAPNTTLPLAAALAERLRKHIESNEMVITHGSSETLKINITVSIGVADMNQKGGDCQNLIRNVDEMLMWAKKEGRNRIAIYNADNEKKARFPGE